VASGACFPLATRILNDDDADAEGRLVARAYAANTWGSVVGSLTAGFVIAAWLDFEPSLRVVGIGYFIAAAIGAIALRRTSSLAPILGGVAVLACVATGARVATRASFAERYELARPDRHVLRHDAGIQGVTTVTESRDPAKKAAVIYVNHHGMTVKLTDTKMMAHLPLFLHEKPDDTLIICFGMGTTFRSALSHGGRATVVEIVPEVADSFEYFYADAAQLRANQRGRIVIGDGRHFLNATSQRFDVITLDPPPPIDGEGVNHLYSRDFAVLARAHLKPGGIVAHWIPAPGTGSGVDDAESIEMLLRTFNDVFRYATVVVAFNNVGFHILGSDEPIDASPERIAQRLALRPAAVADMNELQQVDPAFLSSGEPLSPSSQSDLVVTDDHPVLEFNLMRNLIRGNPKVLSGHLWVP
jgi:predicted membrane-bound spermidine synthase